MSRATLVAFVVMFSLPFLLLMACYAALPVEVPVLRVGGAVLFATKSIFTVFRVPVMNLTHGLMAAVMLSRAGDFKDAQRRVSYAGVFLALMFTAALKSDLEALDTWSLGRFCQLISQG